MAGGGSTSTDWIPGTFIPRRTCVSVTMKQQEGDIDLCAILILSVGSVDNALYAREIFLVSVIIITACAKDDAANMNGKQDSLPEKSPPVSAPEWYPTPKRSSGPAGYSAAPSATPPGSQFIQDRQTTRQAPAAGVSAGMTDKTQQYQWPSDQKSAKYSPWNTGQAPAQTPGGPATTGSRRPWGGVQGVQRSRCSPGHLASTRRVFRDMSGSQCIDRSRFVLKMKNKDINDPTGVYPCGNVPIVEWTEMT